MKEDQSMFKIGDNICYLKVVDADKAPLKGMVLEVKDKIRISYFNATKQNVVWVNPDDLELQNTSRCAHNAECGWCDDTGKCIYE